jgi:hypothetical protein
MLNNCGLQEIIHAVRRNYRMDSFSILLLMLQEL